VVLAVRGADEHPADLEAHLGRRVAELERLERKSADACLGMLVSSAREGAEAPEALEALVLLGLAHPKAVARLGIALGNYGRRAAALYERQEREDRSRALLNLLAQRLGDNRAVERDLASLLRRSGDLDQLVRRYTARAQERIDAGKPAEALPWLQEVLVADPSRKDVARIIRDLRFEAVERVQRRRRVRRVALVAASLSMLVSLLFLREQRVGEAFGRLMVPAPTELPTMEHRLAQLEAFAADYPLWHGSLRVVQERTRLRADIEARRSRLEAERERERLAIVRRNGSADTAAEAARREADLGRWDQALLHFRAALELASEDWQERAWAQRNVEALERLLEEAR